METITPGTPVNCSATEKGWERKRWTRRARLTEETLDAAGPVDRGLVLVREFVHAQDGDDVLEFLVALEDLLHALGGVVMGLAHDVRVQDAGSGFQRIHGRIDAEGGNLTAQDRGGVQMGEGCRRSRVREVIGRDIDRLHRGDGSVLGRCDALLHLAHFRGQRRLVTHGGRHTAEQGRHLRTRLGETEDIVDEEEDVARALAGVAVTEGFRERQAAQGHAGTGSRGFVHLAEDHRHLGFLEFLLVYEGEVPFAFFHRLVKGVAVADDVGFDHLAEEVVALAGTLAHAGEDGNRPILPPLR